MGLFKRDKAPSLKEKLLSEGKLNRQRDTLRKTIQTLDAKLKAMQTKAFDAKKENNYPKAEAALASIDVIEQRLHKLNDIDRVLSAMMESLEDQTLKKKLMENLDELNGTLPKSKRKKHPTSETVILSDAVEYLEKLLPDASTHVDGNVKSIKKDDLDAFFDSGTS
ncbi:MAG: hypothetical protein ACOC14_05220 [Bacillota bacterium]